MPCKQAVTLVRSFKSLLQRDRTKEITHSSDRVVSSAYLRLLLLSVILIPACSSSGLAFHMMYMPSSSAGKNLHAVQEMWVDVGSIPGLGWSPGEVNVTHSHAWEIAWTEESGGWQSMGSQRVGHSLAMQTTIQLKISWVSEKMSSTFNGFFLFISVNNFLSFWLILSLLGFLRVKSNLFPNS